MQTEEDVRQRTDSWDGPDQSGQKQSFNKDLLDLTRRNTIIKLDARLHLKLDSQTPLQDPDMPLQPSNASYLGQETQFDRLSFLTLVPLLISLFQVVNLSFASKPEYVFDSITDCTSQSRQNHIIDIFFIYTIGWPDDYPFTIGDTIVLATTVESDFSVPGFIIIDIQTGSTISPTTNISVSSAHSNRIANERAVEWTFCNINWSLSFCTSSRSIEFWCIIIKHHSDIFNRLWIVEIQRSYPEYQSGFYCRIKRNNNPWFIILCCHFQMSASLTVGTYCLNLLSIIEELSQHQVVLPVKVTMRCTSIFSCLQQVQVSCLNLGASNLNCRFLYGQ